MSHFYLNHAAFLSPNPLTSFHARRVIPQVSQKPPHCLPTCSASTPDSFSTEWYRDITPALDVDLASYHIPNSNAAPASKPTDHNFVDAGLGIMAMVDYALPSPQGAHVLSDIRQTLSRNTALYDREARMDIRRALSSAILSHGAPPGSSALVMDCSSTIVRMAWAGSCGFVIIRDSTIIYRSYPEAAPRDALESHLRRTANDKTEKNAKYWLSWGGNATQSATGGYYAASLVTGARQEGPFTIGCDEVHADYLELQDNDLIIAGSDGFFSNVNEEQILAFVRPLPDGAEDKTLSLANSTCLGSWRRDDVDFISYYLAIIAENFATAANSKPHLPFPFPPSPHVDDVTVMCAAFTFQSDTGT